MPQIITEETIIGEPIVEWTSPEYEKEDRSKRWYVVMGIALGLVVVYALWQGNYFLPPIVMLFAIVLYLQTNQEPPIVLFGITDNGVYVGNRFYLYSELENFFIIYDPPRVATLYIQTKSSLRPMLRFPILAELDPMQLRDVLLPFLGEDDEAEEPLSDRFARNWMMK